MVAILLLSNFSIHVHIFTLCALTHSNFRCFLHSKPQQIIGNTAQCLHTWQPRRILPKREPILAKKEDQENIRSIASFSTAFFNRVVYRYHWLATVKREIASGRHPCRRVVLCVFVCLLFRAYFSGERKNRTFFSNVARRSVGLFDCEFSARKKYQNFRSVIPDGNDGSLTAARRLVCELLRCSSFGWFMQLNILMKLCDKFFVCSMKIKSFAKKDSSGSARERVRPTAGIAFCARKR